MTLFVRNEIDVIGATIEHHIAAGVDLIIATDNASTDGTTDILAMYRDADVLELAHEPRHDHEQGRAVTNMARRAASNYGAHWVINCDADEFFWPIGVDKLTSNELTKALETVGTNYGRISARRSNLISDPRKHGSWVQRLVIRDNESVNTATGKRIAPKCCHRSDPHVVVSEGNHIVSGPTIQQFGESPLEVLHVPNRSYKQYERKIVNGGSALASNKRLPVGVGSHWRYDYESFLNGELYPIYCERQLTTEKLENGLTTGRLTRDTRLRNRLGQLRSQAIVPEALDFCFKQID